jgi:putative endonuclease
MHYVYVLYSASTDGFYVGETADLQLRLSMHNDHLFKGAVTAKASDWSVQISFRTENRQQAIIVEKYIPRKKSHKYSQCSLPKSNEIQKKFCTFSNF